MADQPEITGSEAAEIESAEIAEETASPEDNATESSATDEVEADDNTTSADVDTATEDEVVTDELEVEEEDSEAAAQKTMARREFLTYTWGAAMGLLTAQAGGLSYFFMYPRFRAGEFGGKFFIGPESTIPASDQAPQGNATGKFWLVSTEDANTKAIYMVCTHLGCLYKWNQSTFRFECPCHGSKFSHDGDYIEGPAPRSLDYFAIEVDDKGEVAVDTGKKIAGDPAAESPARAVVG